MFNSQAKNARVYPESFIFTNVDSMSRELDALEKSSVQNLGTDYPLLFEHISGMIQKITIDFPWAVAETTIVFDDASNEIVRAVFLSNGLLQLKLGASCIRACLAEPFSREASKKQDALKVLLEQELRRIYYEGFRRAEIELSMVDGTKSLKESPVLLQMLHGFVEKVKNEIGCSREAFLIGIGRVSPCESVGIVIAKGGIISIFFSEELIKQLLFNQRHECAQKNYSFFKWFIAHALGHLEDPLFVLNFRYPNVKKGLLGFAAYFSAGLMEKISNSDRVLIYLYYLLYLDLWVLSGIVFLFFAAAFGIIFMQRRMEYFADAFASRAVGIGFEDVQELLELAYGDAKQKHFALFTRDKISYQDENGKIIMKKPRFFVAQREWLFLKICAIGSYISMFHKYPSVEKRIRRLKRSIELTSNN